MTPKEKAKELVERFRPYVRESCEESSREEKMKQCALICIDEIINNPALSNREYKGWDNNPIQYKKFWQEVKQEIKKM